MDPSSPLPDPVRLVEESLSRFPPGRPALVHRDRREDTRVSAEDLLRRIRATAVSLRQGAEPGDRVVLALPPGPDFVAGFLGAWFAGLTPVPAPPPGGAARRAARDRLAALVADCRPRRVLEVLDEPPEGAEAVWVRPSQVADALALVQYTSGSTGRPRGVLVRSSSLVANLLQMQEQLVPGVAGPGVSWTPPYHDMGLVVGILLPLVLGETAVLMAPERFLERPIMWLRAIHDHRAGFSAAPDSAYRMAVARTAPEERAGLDLSSWKFALNGAEPVRAETLERFSAAFAPHGFAPEAFRPSWGLAEATVYASGGGRVGPLVAGFDPVALERGRVIPQDLGGAVRLVSSGRPAPGSAVLVVEPGGDRVREEGRVGELWLSGPQTTRGYFGAAEGDAGAGSCEGGMRIGMVPSGPGSEAGPPGERFLATGDLGFVHQGEVFVTGRHKDLIVHRGRNILPHDLEARAEASHAAVRQGSAMAFAVPGEDTDDAVVAVALAPGSEGLDPQEPLAAIRRAASRDLDLPLASVLLLRPGDLPRTSSGKPMRAELRTRFLAGGLEPLARLERGAPGPAGQAAPGERVAELVELLTRLFAKALDAERVGPGEDFFDRGGDSLRAALLVADVRESLELSIPIDTLFANPTPETFASALIEAMGRAGSAATAPRRAPGPSGHLLYGHMADWEEDPLGFLTRAFETYGDLVHLDFGGIPVLLVGSPDGIQHVLHTRARRYRRETGAWQRFRRLAGRGLLSSDGAPWAVHRRTMNPWFLPHALAGVPALARARTEAWLAQARGGELVVPELLEAFFAVMVEVAAAAFFGLELGDSARALSAAMLAAQRSLGTDLVSVESGGGVRLQPGVSPELEAALVRVRGLMDPLGEELVARPRPGLAAALAALDEPPERFRDELVTVLFTAGGGPASALTWAVAELVAERNPGEGCREAILPAGREGTMAVLREAMRLHPPVAVAARAAAEADEIGGVDVPAGSYVLAVPYRAHRHPGYWDEPERFRPERFLPGGSLPAHPAAYAPFGTGPHRCIGEVFAELAMPVVLETLVERTRIVPGEPGLPRSELSFALRPRDYPVSLRLGRKGLASDGLRLAAPPG